ncbi:MAG: 50S ribosomal protein L18 [Deltaproteobacteria bacterium]|jgi:large subunit ribosomal protein L18|nr:50S ribosomal protein L18 [Deltaproteobacteria bacterium]
MGTLSIRRLARQRRRERVRKKVKGTPAQPRLCVFRSASHIYAQVIDDENSLTLAAASTLAKDLREQVKGLKKIEQAREVGKFIGKIIKDKGLEKVVFDRNGYLYHGRVKALSEGARESGLIF